MSRFNREPVPVVIGPCECAGTPHGDGDIVYLAPELSMSAGMAAQGAILEAAGDSVRLMELLARVYIAHGVVAWNLLDDAGKPIPLDPATVAAALPYGKGGRLVAEKADELYSEDIVGPLLARLSSLSRTGSTAATTSPRPTRTRKPSRRSSPPASAASRPSAA